MTSDYDRVMKTVNDVRRMSWWLGFVAGLSVGFAVASLIIVIIVLVVGLTSGS